MNLVLPDPGPDVRGLEPPVPGAGSHPRTQPRLQEAVWSPWQTAGGLQSGHQAGESQGA